jgi:hypothetical protein
MMFFLFLGISVGTPVTFRICRLNSNCTGESSPGGVKKVFCRASKQSEGGRSEE